MSARPAPLDEEQRRYRDRLDEAVTNTPAYAPASFRGRGIVICGGGRKYFPGAYVSIRALRHLGCSLPVELWYLGDEECTEEMRAIIEPYGVKPVDGHIVRERESVHAPGGWELKCLALLYSSFQEVLLLDADNLPVVNPQFLFDIPRYREHGAVFWPDYGRLGHDRLIWAICGVAHRDEPEFESGQILIDKSRCWKALRITMHLNENSEFYYRHIHGDKDTFHLAWRKLDQSYAMPDHPIHSLPFTMCQHDFDGRRIFQHRNMDKWRPRGCNARIDGFALEDQCFEWLDELAELWDPVPEHVNIYSPELRTPQELEVANEVTARPYDYHRVGADRRIMTFRADGRIWKGAGGCEMWWDLSRRDGRICLEVYGENGLTMRLARDPDGVWRGRWLQFERMPIELTPLSTPQAE